jgi:hypothetical protein
LCSILCVHLVLYPFNVRPLNTCDELSFGCNSHKDQSFKHVGDLNSRHACFMHCVMYMLCAILIHLIYYDIRILYENNLHRSKPTQAIGRPFVLMWVEVPDFSNLPFSNGGLMWTYGPLHALLNRILFYIIYLILTRDFLLCFALFQMNEHFIAHRTWNVTSNWGQAN